MSNKSNVNVAVQMYAFFMQGTVRNVLAQQARDRILGLSASYNECRRHRADQLPKGFTAHNPAGTKIAKLAYNHAIGVKHI